MSPSGRDALPATLPYPFCPPVQCSKNQVENLANSYCTIQSKMTSVRNAAFIYEHEEPMLDSELSWTITADQECPGIEHQSKDEVSVKQQFPSLKKQMLLLQ